MASPPAETSDIQPAPVVFRSNKKRKANLRRPRVDEAEENAAGEGAKLENTSVADPSTAATSDDKSNDTAAAISAEPQSTSDVVDQLLSECREATADDAQHEPSVAEALRLRNLRRSRLNGVGFKASASSAAHHENDNEERSLAARAQDEELAEVNAGGMTSRFAPQTGLVGEVVNKHMMEYIESKLSKRGDSSAASKASPHPGSASASAPASRPLCSASTTAAARPGVSTLQGKLMEVDLGDEARARAIALTERARRRLAAGDGDGGGTSASEADDAEGDEQHPKKKARIGPDGKPWRSRNRRDSDDVTRDRLVEEFLRENRLDVYDNPVLENFDDDGHDEGLDAAAHPSAANTFGFNTSADQKPKTADDRLAEAFRREFYDAMAARRSRNRAPVNQYRRPQKHDKEEVLRGPKLGGSRNSRAAMRDLLLAKEREKQGKR